jgi:hypothetical protein
MDRRLDRVVVTNHHRRRRVHAGEVDERQPVLNLRFGGGVAEPLLHEVGDRLHDHVVRQVPDDMVVAVEDRNASHPPVVHDLQTVGDGVRVAHRLDGDGHLVANLTLPVAGPADCALKCIPLGEDPTDV